jgi:KUP system potassium uptake protein
MVVTGAALFLFVDLAFFSANVTKIVHGGWFPLSIAAIVFLLLTTWQKGREIVSRNRTEEEGPLRSFVDDLHRMRPPVYRAPGTGVFLNANKETTPLAMRANVEHNHTLHAHVVIISIETLRVPHVADEDQVLIDDLGYANDGISHVTARLGFQDEVDVPHVLQLAIERGLERECDLATASYFISRMTIVPTTAEGMSALRKRLFLVVARNASDPVQYFKLPDDQTVVMGSHVPL